MGENLQAGGLSRVGLKRGKQMWIPMRRFDGLGLLHDEDEMIRLKCEDDWPSLIDRPLNPYNVRSRSIEKVMAYHRSFSVLVVALLIGQFPRMDRDLRVCAGSFSLR